VIDIAAEVSTALAPVLAELASLRQQVTALVQSSPPQFFSVAEAAKRAGLCEWTIRRMAKAGELVSRRAGRRLLIDSSSLKATDPGTVSRLSREARS
jgi:excisionase family DNA binding protein